MTSRVRREARPEPGAREPERAATEVRLTAPGALLVVLGATLVGALLDGLITIGYGHVTGVAFTAGCVLAAWKSRPRELALITVTPPALFVAGVMAAETLYSLGGSGWFRSQVVAVTAALAADALWIVAGTAAVLLIALGKGGLQELSQRRAARRGAPSRSSPASRPAHRPPARDQHPAR